MTIDYTNGGILQAALEFARLGFRVVPTHGLVNGYCTCGGSRPDCKPGKHPATAHGYKDATTDAEAIRQWWANQPWANVAIVQGGHVFVVEDDPRHGGDATMAKLQAEHGTLPETPTARSGGGGTHRYFAYPEGVVIRSRSDVAPGVDVRGDGGYALAPPSTHASGNRYEWITTPDTPLADPPQWILDLVCDPKSAKQPGAKAPSPKSFVMVASEADDFASHPGAGEGRRNNALCRLLGVHISRGDSPKTIEALALAWGARCTPPIPAKDIHKRIVWVESKRDDDGVNSFPSPAEGINSGSGDGGVNSFPKQPEGINSPPSDGIGDGVNSFLPDVADANEDGEGINSFLPDAANGGVSPTPHPTPTTVSPPTDTVNSVRSPDLDLDPLTIFENRNTFDEKRTTLYVNENDNGSVYVNVCENESASAYDNVHVNENGSEYVHGSVLGSGSDNDDANGNDTVGVGVGVGADALRDAEGEDAEAEGVDTVGGDGWGADAEGVADSAPELGKEGINSPGDGFPVLAPEAYHGIMGDIVRSIAPETEADPAGVLITFLAHVGNAIGKGAHFTVGTTRHCTNLFTVLVGDTASGKGIAESVVEYLMRGADSGHADALGHGLSSGEGLIDRVRDDDPPEGDDGANAFAFPTEKRFLAIETEFIRPITSGRREGNTLSAILRTAWDGGILETLTRTTGGSLKKPAKPMRASNAHVSVIGHITAEELTVALGKNGGVDLANGFANRFLWTCVRRSRLLPHGGDASVLEPFTEPLAKALAKARRIGRVTRDDDANRLWEGVYESLTASKPGAYGLVVGRGRAHVVRLSLIYALLDGSNVITPAHLRAALAVWNYCEASAKAIFGGGFATVPQPLNMRILDVIAKTPGVSRTDLLRMFREVHGDAMGDELATLETQRLAHKRMAKHDGGGRPAECWYPGPPDDNGNDTSGGFTFTMGTDETDTDDNDDDGGGKDTPAVVAGEGINSGHDTGTDTGVNSFLPEPETQTSDVGAEPPSPETPNPHPISPTPDTVTTTTMGEILNGLAAKIAEEHGITPPDFGDDDHDHDDATDHDHDDHNDHDDDDDQDDDTSNDIDIDKDQPMHDDDIRRLFEGALAAQRLTFEQAEHPETLTRTQRDGLDWVYAYTRSQAERIARERETAAEPRLFEAEMATFWATL